MRLWEWYFGLPAARPGQGTEWGLRFSPLGSGAMPVWVAVLVLIGIVIGVLLIYRRDAAQLPLLRQLPLMLLRMLSLALLLVMLGHMTLTVRRTGLPTLALAIDTSASMGLEDSYRDAAPGAFAEALANDLQQESATRLDIVKELLLKQDGRLLRQLQESHRVHLYRFDTDAWPVEDVLAGATAAGDLDQQDTLPERISSLTADGAATRPLPAVRSILDDLRGSPPSALLMFTDGITTTGDHERFPAAAQYAHTQAVPMLLLGVGSEEPAQDLQLTDVLADDVVFVGDPVTFSFLLKNYGYQDETARVTLREASSPDVLNAAEVTLVDSRQPHAGELTWVPGEPGDYEFVVEAEPRPGESTTANNSLTARVSVRKEQLRVLLVDRVPRWEYRHLKTVLERDPAISLDCVLQDADAGYSQDDRSALQRFPVNRDELFAYDVIIFGDVQLAYLNQDTPEHLRDFVAERGGGLVMVAGELHHPHDYRGTTLEDLLPVEIAEQLADEAGPSTSGFRAQLTPAGSSRAVLRLADTTPENRAVWDTLPPLYWFSPSGRRKPGAETLVIHPSRFTAEGPMPLIASQRYGAGQVVFHATDELWRWRERVEDRYYGRYWLQLMRYLSRSRLRSEGQSIELSTDRNVYQPGESIEVRVRFFDQRLIPREADGVAVVIEGPSGFRERVSLAPLTEAPFLFIARLRRLGTGSYRAWLAEPALTAPPPADPPPADTASVPAAPAIVPSVNFRVESPEGELRDRLFRQADLASAARISRGAYVPFWQAGKLIARLPQGKPVPISAETAFPLWNRPEVLLALVMLLTLEWIFRKRAGLV